MTTETHHSLFNFDQTRLCRQTHEELAESGWDRRKGYCEKKWGVFQVRKFGQLGGARRGSLPLFTFSQTENLGECEADYDHHYDCQRLLLCANKLKDELENLGLDPRKVYCNLSVEGEEVTESFGDIGGRKDEVCFNPYAAVGTIGGVI